MYPPPECPFPETYLNFSIPAWERWSDNLDLINSLDSETTQSREWIISSEMDLFCESVKKKKHSESFSHESFTYQINIIDDIFLIKCTGNVTTEIN